VHLSHCTHQRKLGGPCCRTHGRMASVADRGPRSVQRTSLKQHGHIWIRTRNGNFIAPQRQKLTTQSSPVLAPHCACPLPMTVLRTVVRTSCHMRTVAQQTAVPQSDQHHLSSTSQQPRSELIAAPFSPCQRHPRKAPPTAPAPANAMISSCAEVANPNSTPSVVSEMTAPD
jgi:hypothetical protein